MTKRAYIEGITPISFVLFLINEEILKDLFLLQKNERKKTFFLYFRKRRVIYAALL